eukprot:Gb_14965 [translate_table: standard]
MRFDQTATKVTKKRLWNMLRIALLIIRRGGNLLKHRLSEDFHVAIQRGKDLGKNLRSLIFHHHNTYRLNYLGEYEFSCTNSPAGPVAFDFRKRERHHHFLALGSQMPCKEILLDESVAIVSGNFIQMEYNSGEYSAIQATKNGLVSSDGEDESEQQVDREAEEFIGRFYAQMKLQRQISMLNYQEMLARGAN